MALHFGIFIPIIIVTAREMWLLPTVMIKATRVPSMMQYFVILNVKMGEDVFGMVHAIVLRIGKESIVQHQFAAQSVRMEELAILLIPVNALQNGKGIIVKHRFAIQGARTVENVCLTIPANVLRNGKESIVKHPNVHQNASTKLCARNTTFAIVALSREKDGKDTGVRST